MLMYTIQDNEGNYTSELSFQWDSKKCKEFKIYSSATGRCNAMRYYTDIKQAKKVLNYLQKTNKQFKSDYTFDIVNVDKYCKSFRYEY